MTTGTSYIDDFGYTDEADDGMIFIFAEVTVANDKIEDGISTNFYIFDWGLTTSDGITYDTSGHTIFHTGYKDVTITKGSKLTYVVVFEVPAVTSLSDVESFTPDYYWYDFKYDSTL